MDTLITLSYFSANMSGWFVQMLTLLVKGTLILTATGLLVCSLRRSPAAARHLAWCAGLMALLLLPVLSALLPHWQTDFHPPMARLLEEVNQEARLGASVPATHPVAPLPTSSVPPPTEPVTNGATPASAAVTQAGLDDNSSHGEASRLFIANLNFHWSSWAFLAWLVGFAFMLGRLVIAHAGAHMLVIRSGEVVEDDWRQLARDAARQMGVKRSVRLRWSAWTRVPLSIGVWSPTIVMPEAAKTWDQRRRQTVLFHELAHIKRRDCLMQLLTQITCAFYWINPLVWIAAHNVRFERERSADDMVLLAGVQASTYAETLLEIAQSLRSAKKSTVAALAMAKHSRLESRLSAILQASSRQRRLSLTGAITVVATVASIVLPLAILHPVQANVESMEAVGNVASDTVQTITGARLPGVKEFTSDSEFESGIEPNSNLNPGTAAESDIASTNESFNHVDLTRDAAAVDTLTAEQLKVLRKKFGIDSTFIHEIKMLGFMDMSFDDYVAFGENDIGPDYIRGMQAAGLRDLTKSDLVSLAINGIDPDFVKSKRATGYADLTMTDYIALAANGIDPNYIRGMQRAGLKDLTRSELIAMAVNDIDPNYIRGMQRAGLKDLTRSELIAMAVNDIDPNYIRGMQAIGYADLTIRDYISLAINEIDPNYIRGMQRAGLKDLTRSELIAMAVNDIDPNYIRGMQAIGYADLTIRGYISLAINKIDPDYIRGMQRAGLTELTKSELIAMAVNDIDPNYIRGMQAIGYADQTIRDYISLAINEIDPNYIRGMQRAGLKDLTRSELIAMAVNDIDPNYIRGMQAIGYADLTIRDYISLAINDVDPNYVRGMQGAGLKDLTKSELIAMAANDIDPNYIRGMQAAGYIDLTVAELIALVKKSTRQE